MTRSQVLGILALSALPAGARAQIAPDYRKEFLLQFDQSMDKFIQLAEAMPSERYKWSPGPGVMEVAQVYMHVARYNYQYPMSSLSAPRPSGVNLETMEQVRDKAAVLRALRESAEYARSAAKRIEGEQWSKATQLYGREVPQWSVMLQLVAHMNEHLGQSIAYARMNSIVPPWSR